jgi:hypothetical protein
MELVACVINSETNIVENVIVLGGTWIAPEGFYLVVSSEGAIGYSFDKATGKFSNPFDNHGEVP